MTVAFHSYLYKYDIETQNLILRTFFAVIVSHSIFLSLNFGYFIYLFIFVFIIIIFLVRG